MTEHLLLPSAEVRFDVNADNGVLSGYAAVFNAIVPRYREMVQPGAFRRTLAEHRSNGTRPMMLWGHDPDHPIGTWTDLTEDDRGLKVTGKLVLGVAKADEARALLSAGAVNGLSIGFTKRSDFRNASGIRVLTDVDLPEISLCAFPAAPGARVTSFRHSAPADLAAFAEAARRTARSLRG